VIQVSRDYEGLEQAAYELFRESLDRSAEDRIRGDELNVERMIEDAAPRFTLSDGFYERARYLLGLEEMMATGITFRAEDVYLTDVKGLTALKRARERFAADHPGCRNCGQRNAKHRPKCLGCGEKVS
jgi:hypothetical protein